jgi:DNA-binding FadR family transcriptional regulator
VIFRHPLAPTIQGFPLRLRIGLLYCSITVHQPTLHEYKLHEKARRDIERLIADRGIQPGTRIPAECELARELYVSVTTIRTALKALEQKGKIEHAPGRWTIVR